MALNRESNRLVLGLSNGSLCLVDLRSGKQSMINAHNAQVDLIVFDKDYSEMATASSDRTIDIFDCSSIETLPPIVIKDIHNKVRNMALTSQNKLVAITDKNEYSILTSEDVMADKIENLLRRNITEEEWGKYFKDIKYEKTVNNLAPGN